MTGSPRHSVWIISNLTAFVLIVVIVVSCNPIEQISSSIITATSSTVVTLTPMSTSSLDELPVANTSTASTPTLLPPTPTFRVQPNTTSTPLAVTPLSVPASTETPTSLPNPTTGPYPVGTTSTSTTVVTPTSDVWHGEYFNNLEFRGPPAHERDDSVIDFDWYVNEPAPGVVTDVTL